MGKSSLIVKIFSIILVALAYLTTTVSAWSVAVHNTTDCSDFFDETSGQDIPVSYFAYSNLHSQVSSSACFALGRYEESDDCAYSKDGGRTFTDCKDMIDIFSRDFVDSHTLSFGFPCDTKCNVYYGNDQCVTNPESCEAGKCLDLSDLIMDDKLPISFQCFDQEDKAKIEECRKSATGPRANFWAGERIHQGSVMGLHLRSNDCTDFVAHLGRDFASFEIIEYMTFTIVSTGFMIVVSSSAEREADRQCSLNARTLDAAAGERMNASSTSRQLQPQTHTPPTRTTSTTFDLQPLCIAPIYNTLDNLNTPFNTYTSITEPFRQDVLTAAWQATIYNNGDCSHGGANYFVYSGAGQSQCMTVGFADGADCSYHANGGTSQSECGATTYTTWLHEFYGPERVSIFVPSGTELTHCVTIGTNTCQTNNGPNCRTFKGDADGTCMQLNEGTFDAFNTLQMTALQPGQGQEVFQGLDVLDLNDTTNDYAHRDQTKHEAAKNEQR
ncbi:uncharacterized protein MYCFIDRAFT_179617 [Pseudocercospora fijiensis CIRAD86]|uniref:Uncharacterized protein n=1 Tax=Pseudocercospora fijiensis (strain CIRAD86) TaxID=383855 RepID=M3A1C2_PSEFD|nr:uncharacterized protein MYCFIDRAFT_179617 [Pseudocercospora fijiensis CIRAD86]EME78181.1 hypothetical protein MYCFIDRAFT_179617 [Pseudocercospora fijiensis CIRAD86]